MTALLVQLLIFAIIIGIVYFVLQAILSVAPIPEPFKRIIWLIAMGVLCIVAILKVLVPLLNML
jgi:hypothetical protein